jgi:hypothetical protein
MMELSPESMLVAYAITIGISLAVLVGIAAQYLVWRSKQIRRESRMQKRLREAVRETVDKIAA